MCEETFFQPPVRVGICGTGKVARAFLRRWLTMPETVAVVWVHGRRAEGVKALRHTCGGDWEVAEDWVSVAGDVDWVALAVSDDAIADFASKALPAGVRYLHFSGSVPAPVGGAVLWPIRAIHPTDEPDWDEMPCALQWPENTNSRADWLRATAPALQIITENARQQAHLAAVFAANVPNHAFAVAQSLAAAAGVPWSAFAPLVEGVGATAIAGHSAQAQTGPAIRRDAGTVGRHRVWLEENAPHLLPFYNAATDSIQHEHPRKPHEQP